MVSYLYIYLAHFLRIKVFSTISIFLKQFSRTMAEQFVVCDLKFKGPAIPLIVELHIVGMDESQLLIYIRMSI